MSSLRKQLEELTNPTPALADIEDEDFDGLFLFLIYQF